MSQLSIIGLFCEDIREESGDIFTLIGLLPDVIITERAKAGEEVDVSRKNKLLSKICVFVRANFDPNEQLKLIELKLTMPNGAEVPIGGAQTDVIELAKTQAREKELPLAGVVMRAILGGFKLPKPGILSLEATIDGEPRLLAMLKFQLDEPTSSPTAPSPPSLQ